MREKPVNQKGMTLVELLIAIVIAGFIVVGASVALFQLLTVSDRNSDYVTAYTEVQNAGFNISHDAVQAQGVSVIDDLGTPERELLTLDWIDSEGNAHQAVYTLEDASDGLKELWRDYSNGVTQETIRVARYIDDPGTSCTWDDIEKVLTLVVTAQVEDQTATRTYNVEPRPLS